LELANCLPIHWAETGEAGGTFVTSTIANRLARICAHSAQAPEWEQLVRLVTPGVALAARRVGSIWGDESASTVNEIVQEVFLKLCENNRRILRDFDDRGQNSFARLLRRVTASVATDYFRRVQADKRGGRVRAIHIHNPRISEEISDVSSAEAVQLPTLIAQLDGLLLLYPEAVSVRDRELFWLYYRQGLTADAIARIPSIGLTPKGVESALSRLNQLLRNTILYGKPNGGPWRKKRQFSIRDKESRW
jgi:RNA polymerase sigma-70 factor (ECF subfamily)